jgi:predicted RNA-binding protein with PIN domain
MPARVRELVVDGYNVIRTSPKYRDLVDEEILDPLLHDVYIRARESLISDVATYAKGRYHATIVFDGFGNPAPDRPVTRSAGVTIVFSREGEEADAVIERLVHEGRSRGHEMTVVTGDRLIQNAVIGDGVVRMSSRAFARESAQIGKMVYEQREAPNHRQHSTVADHLSPEVRHKLWLMARGQMDLGSEGASAGGTRDGGARKGGKGSGAAGSGRVGRPGSTGAPRGSTGNGKAGGGRHGKGR